MTLTAQLMLGTVCLMVCSLVHVSVIAFVLPKFPVFNAAVQGLRPTFRYAAVLSAGLFAIVAAHTIEIWIWALSFLYIDAFDDFETSFYFSTVTYTTLGYGDLVLKEGLRVFGTFASVTGLLTFGISTAFLIGIVVRLIPSFADARK